MTQQEILAVCNRGVWEGEKTVKGGDDQPPSRVPFHPAFLR